MTLAKPLNQQLLQRALLFSALFCAAALLLHMYLGHRAKQQQLAEVPQRIEQQVMPMLAQSVWDVDQAATQQLLQDLLQQDGIRQISLRNNQGAILLELGNINGVSHAIELPVQSHRTGDQPLGMLHIGLSQAALEQQLWRDNLLILLELLAGLSGLTVLCYRFQQQRFLQPLRQLQERILPAANLDAEDEISALSTALQQLQQQQQGYEATHLRQEHELARHRDHLAELVAMRTAELEHLSRFQHLISELSTRFIHLPLEEQHQAVDSALERIGTLLEVDRCYLFRVTPEMTIHDNQEWCASGVKSTAGFYEDYPISESLWFVPQLMRQQLLAFSSLDEIPQEGHYERERFAEHGIQSIAVVTLSHQGQVLGFVGCDAVNRSRSWLDKELSLLRLVGEMLCNVLLRKQHMEELDNAQHALAQANAKLESIANTDGLTGLANRRLFDLRKQQEFSAACSLQQPLSVLLLDVDLFKAYNDCFGHLEGDQCLRQLASELQQQFPHDEELVARIGGEEFAVLLPRTDSEHALQQAEQLRQRVWQLAIPHMASAVSTHVTISIGVASLDLSRHDSIDDLLAEADSRLYQAKHQGRNRVVGP
ncbi:GGDEF domain-containing protein [Vogesella oryzae]|uniref:GGDEF domain-containing protein n=1 Tax=Vogesella oryzae TaxID=1735285 RepID=UPI001582476C|nr:diguanylate cyclase [Vogesella oryzae]